MNLEKRSFIGTDSRELSSAALFAKPITNSGSSTRPPALHTAATTTNSTSERTVTLAVAVHRSALSNAADGVAAAKTPFEKMLALMIRWHTAVPFQLPHIFDVQKDPITDYSLKAIQQMGRIISVIDGQPGGGYPSCHKGQRLIGKMLILPVDGRLCTNFFLAWNKDTGIPEGGIISNIANIF